MVVRRQLVEDNMQEVGWVVFVLSLGYGKCHCLGGLVYKLLLVKVSKKG